MPGMIVPPSDPSAADPWPGRNRGCAHHKAPLPPSGTADRFRRIRPCALRTADNPAMAWKLRGTYVETCSCDFFCPCNFNLAIGADYDRCRVALVFNITDGDVESTDVSGLAVVVIADTPKVMTDGNWRVGTVIDAKASDEQAAKLQAVFSGDLGGPMAALGPLIGENLGVQHAPIEVRDDGVRHSVRIGDTTGFDI